MIVCSFSYHIGGRVDEFSVESGVKHHCSLGSNYANN